MPTGKKSTRARGARKGSSKRLQKKSAPVVADADFSQPPSPSVIPTTALFIDDEAGVSGANVSSDEDRVGGDDNEYEVGSFVVPDDVSTLSSLSSPDALASDILDGSSPSKDSKLGESLLNFDYSHSEPDAANTSRVDHKPGVAAPDEIEIEWSVTPSPRTKLRNRLAKHKFQPPLLPHSTAGAPSSPDLVMSSPVLATSPLPKAQIPSARALVILLIALLCLLLTSWPTSVLVPLLASIPLHRLLVRLCPLLILFLKAHLDRLANAQSMWLVHLFSMSSLCPTAMMLLLLLQLASILLTSVLAPTLMFSMTPLPP
ncbi:hypothetical protein F5880DRAFT_175737 [Lentinula raphanica]|nr:hypothetical protein F5880DRAFT_175737 [Lentinula raphanica]